MQSLSVNNIYGLWSFCDPVFRKSASFKALNADSKDSCWLYCHEKLSTTEPIVDASRKNVLTAIKIPMRTVGFTSLTASSFKACALLLVALFSTKIECALPILLAEAVSAQEAANELGGCGSCWD